MKAITSLVLSCSICICAVDAHATSETEIARQIIARYAGESVASGLKLELIPAEDGRMVYELEDSGRTIKGSSPVAMAKAFYQNAFDKDAGVCSWSGSRFDAEKAFASSPDLRVVCPVRYMQYLNVVTLGYSAPFWDEQRWIKELDWMNLHGINMCIAGVANEEIAARVWAKLGLTEKEIDDFMVGPAHLPWFRMGNLSGYPDRLPHAWRNRSVRLQHLILKEMRERGMEPIVPGFAGFIPKAITRVYPEVKLHELRWDTDHSFFLPPSEPLFRKLAKMYIEEWEKEFGVCTYYIADPFNELKLPWKEESKIRENLRLCGSNIYGGMHDANPNAVWVMQGWIFLERKTWSAERLAAMSQDVPDDKMLILDLAVDYIMSYCRKSGMDWEAYDGFQGKSWIWSVIPNMGGSTDFGMGPLEFYANGRFEAIESPQKGNLIGFGIAPEGIENNEIVYELLSDVYWRTERINLRHWLTHYVRARYGKCTSAMEKCMESLFQGPFRFAHDHPRCRWQASPAEPHWKEVAEEYAKADAVPSKGTVWWGVQNQWDLARREDALKAMEQAAPDYQGNLLFEQDLNEFFVLVEGYRVDKLLYEEQKEREALNTVRAKELQKEIRERMLAMDRRLKGHPTLDMRNWIKMARACAEGNEELADLYETNARRIVTIWGPPTNDYSARVWSGLIGSFYLGRLDEWWYLWDNGLPSKVLPFEDKWVTQRLPID